MRFMATVFGFAALLCASPVLAQGNAEPVEPFKLGTFQIDAGPQVGIVVQDRYVIELDQANAALQIDPMYPQVPMPSDMLELIEQYEYGLKYRIYEIVTDAVTNNRLSSERRPSYIHDVAEVRTLAPILYPGKILNAAANFYSHACEGCTEAEQRESDRNRKENRGIPYLFLKPSRGAVIGTGESVVIPAGRDRIDWEVELGTVIGRAARYVSSTEAEDYVFGYVVSIDVSDRGGRPPGGFGGLDWLVGKGHQTPRSHGAVDRAERVLRRSHGTTPSAAHYRWRDGAGGEGRGHDLLPLGADRVWLVDHHLVSGRRDQQRHLERHLSRRVFRGHPVRLSPAGGGDGGHHRRHRYDPDACGGW